MKESMVRKTAKKAKTARHRWSVFLAYPGENW